VVFLLLFIIWVPTFSNLGDLFTYAEGESIKGISLLQLFQAELLLMLSVGVILFNFNKVKQQTDGDGRVRRHLVLFVWITGQVFVGFIAGGFLVHQDASWYEVMADDNVIMPAQAIILLVCYPAYLFFGGGAYLYTKTRLPVFYKGKEVVFFILTFAPFVFLPYYKGGLSVASNDVMELVYILAYWLLSTAWLAIGVLYLIVQSAKEIFDGLNRPFDEDYY
jgi:hypothetical protein